MPFFSLKAWNFALRKHHNHVTKILKPHVESIKKFESKMDADSWWHQFCANYIKKKNDVHAEREFDQVFDLLRDLAYFGERQSEDELQLRIGFELVKTERPEEQSATEKGPLKPRVSDADNITGDTNDVLKLVSASKEIILDQEE